MDKITFADLGISSEIIYQLTNNKIISPSNVQIQAIPVILNRKNVVAKAPTGSGKTAAFLLPIIELIKEKHEKTPRVIILSPTRELSDQIDSTFNLLVSDKINLKSCLIIGGVKEKHQVEKLNVGVDVIVATPGRLKDLIEKKKIDCSNVQHFVLDEVDMMLDLGFYDDISFIHKQMPESIQIAFFSATIPNKIQSLIKKIMNDYEYIEADANLRNSGSIKQKLYYINNQDKIKLLLTLVTKNLNKPIMVFCNKKSCANFISFFLNKSGIRTRAIHGDKPQYVRSKIINDFKKGICNVLVGTDLAARGIHVDNVGLVINYDIPTNVYNYIHRMGRTGRANQKGECISFSSFLEVDNTNNILKLMQNEIEIAKFNSKDIEPSHNITKEILNSHPSYAIQARNINKLKNNKKFSNRKNNYSSFSSKSMSKKATDSSSQKSKLRAAEERLIKKDNEWESDL
ncbi:DEAD/DEAH box helicase [Mycoplasmoides alvi]|uniref:DEAD/DEAH box helicase n=1 Tax=Mycoplasmoides alvi TaxID=78580 RepID=UPI00069817AB|nr:DEAD/DEAH box helicase [Mycoplasmoides alvi]